MKTRSLIIIFVMAFTGCRHKTTEADAYGNFEAAEVIISSESAGRILRFIVSEGSEIAMGDEIALIDTTLFHLQKAEIDAGMSSIISRVNTINAQNDILEQQVANLEINISRIENMLKDDAATRKQYDDLAGQVAVLRKQIAANNTQKMSVSAELGVFRARKSTLDEQIDRALVKSPMNGTVVEKYSEAGEITAPGKPLVKIADLSVVRLRVFVSGGQLGSVRLGKECSVRNDNGVKEYHVYRGTVSHISSRAEFTPKIIQTKEERVTLVYAVTIDVPNDGTIKSGMPGEVIF
jgi:HlyD family secretion protein